MSALGRTDVFRPLSQLLRLSGTRTSPSEIDLDRPVTTVIDTYPVADRLGQLIVYEPWAFATAPSGTVNTSRTPAQVTVYPIVQEGLRNLGMGGGAWDAWLMELELGLSAAAGFVSCLASYSPVRTGGRVINTVGGTSTFTHYLGYGDTPWFAVSPGSPIPILRTSGGIRYAFGSDAPPHRLPALTSALNIQLTDDSATAVTLIVNATWAFVPKGLRPQL